MIRFALMLVSVGSVAWSADEPHPIDRRMVSCGEQDPSTHGASGCAAAAEKEWDAELNRVYRELLGKSNAADRAKLVAAQRAWLAFRDAEFALIDRLYSPEQGSMFIPMRAYRRMDVVRTRARELAKYSGLPR